MRSICFTAVFCLLTGIGFAQKKTTLPDPDDSILWTKVKYRQLGPFRGGRSGAVHGDYKQKNTFYFGSTGGGVWKTIDGGSNWKNISDKYFGGSIGCVSVAPSDPTILYVGEGENTLRGNVSEGFGIWRTDDGGRSWRNLGLKDTRHIIRIVIHPKNPDIVWVAAIGHLFGPNTERGIFKTTDGGKNWKKVLYINEQTGCSDLVMEPGNPAVLYAGTWRILRTSYSLESGGEGSGLWKSTDGGETWKNISANKGLPKGTWGIVGVAVCPSNTDKIYALMENPTGGLYVSNDAGESWTLQSSDNNIRQRAWYYTKVFVDPKNADMVYVLNVNFLKSTDGGKTFKNINTPHGDHHDLWIDPEDGNRMIIADDGGAQVSFDGGNNWSTYMNQPTGQFYRVSTDMHYPYRILGAQQDNSTIRILSRSDGGQITQDDWQPTAGAESGYVVADPQNPDIVYGGNYSGYLSRYDHKTGENRAVSVWPDDPLGAGADVSKYRFQWNFPVFFSPNNPKKLYAAGNILFATENEGASWTALGGDLTTNDKLRQRSSGGPITKDNTGVEVYCTIFTAAESALEKDLLWTGSDDGLIHISKDGGQHWDNVTPPEAGKWMMWNCVETDPFVKGKAYFAGTKYKSDDFAPYLFKTEDYGKTWTKITNGIAPGHFTRCLRADRKKPGLLYAGTEYGMYISYDDGANWTSFQLNLPIVPITDMTIKENDLIIATQGRSFWVLDDLSVIQQKAAGLTGKNIHVFGINETYRYDGYQNANPKNAGSNPPNGAVVNFYLKNVTDSTKLFINILDKNRKTIRSFSTSAKEKEEKIEVNKGMNQFVWNLYYPPAEKVDGLILWHGNVPGPKAPPGNYYITIRADKDSAESGFVIKANPVYKLTQSDYEDQFNFLITVRDKFTEIQKAIKNIRDVRTQINDFTARQGKDIPKEIKQAADTLNKQMTVIEEALHQTKAKSGQDVLNFPIRLDDKISGLYDFAASGNSAPAKQVRDAYAELSNQADIQLNNLKRLLENDLVSLNQLIREKALPLIGLKKD
ncbi:MAG: glycosyl hydrolase [Chitinophagaceae bacterium]|nr:glycosyl hydrolase [Chitinophagaceae bacterium]